MNCCWKPQCRSWSKQVKKKQEKDYELQVKKDSLKHNLCLKTLFLEVFSKDGLINCLVSGKKTSKAAKNGPQPPQDEACLGQAFNVMIKNYSTGTITYKWLVQKTQNIQNVLRIMYSKL